MPSIEQQAIEYAATYAPRYEHLHTLAEAAAEVANTTPPTNPEQVEAYLVELGEVRAERKTSITSGPCNEEIDAQHSIASIAIGYQQLHVVDLGVFGSKVVSTIRGCGQGVKPRSNAFEERGKVILPSYMGDMVNSIEFTAEARKADPSRMVSGAVQARDVEAYLREIATHHVWVAHEALLMPYENALTVNIDGIRFSNSADFLWVGNRTRRTDSDQINLLRGIRNARGVKIGPSATAEDIEDLALVLNSDKLPGQLSFILRLGLENLHKAPELVRAIDEYAPEALIISDPLHANTYSVKGAEAGAAEGMKTRSVTDAEEEIREVANVCEGIGRKLNGLHLEAIASYTLRQCVEVRGQLPNKKDESLVDPQLNLNQKLHVLRSAKPFLI